MDERSEQVREEFMDIATADMGVNWSDEHIGYTIKKMADEIVRLRDALATVSGERDALVNLVEVLRQYYQRKANDDELYAAFCAWRENPFTGKASA